MSNPRRRLLAPAVVLLAAGLSVGCTSEGDGDRPAATPTSSGSSATATPHPVHTRTRLTHLVGRLPRDEQQRLQHQVGKVVDGWIDAAYVGGDYPRHDFSDAFPGFTPGARAQAHHDRALMTNQPLGPSSSAVVATKRFVFLDVLAPHHHAAAVTARVLLDFRTEPRSKDGDAKRVEVRGRLFLTPGAKGWQVFGYDVAKGTPAELSDHGKGAAHDRKQKPHDTKQSHHHAKGDGR